MKQKVLNDRIKEFEAVFEESRIFNINELLKQFNIQFPAVGIKNMDIDDYIYGRYGIDEKETFCYWLEKKLSDFGRISGSPCFQYGVWYGTRGNDLEVKYRNTKKWGNNVKDSFENIKGSIIDLINSGRNNDFNAIAKSPIPFKLRGKILTTYFPNKYLSIYADDYLNDILKYFNLDKKESLSEQPIFKQERLLKLKSENKILNSWTVMKFAMFINHELDTHYYIETALPDPEDRVPEFPDLLSLNPKFVDHKINNDFQSKEKKKKRPHSKKKIDYKKKSIRSKALGDRGEQIVKMMEEGYLKSHNREDLVNNIDWVSEYTDGQGYDILSFEIGGAPKQIEVKSTTKKTGDANFFLTEFEYEMAKELSNYYIYYVFAVDTLEPKIWRIPNPFKNKKSGVAMIPSIYRVEIFKKNN